MSTPTSNTPTNLTDYNFSTGYVGSYGENWETPTQEQFDLCIAGAIRIEAVPREKIIEALESGKSVRWQKSSNFYYDHNYGRLYNKTIVDARRRQQRDYPNGRKLDCGCTVYYKSHVMCASVGTSCQNCYDRMSD